MSFKTPKIDNPTPAARPERQDAVTAEDIQLGGTQDVTDPTKKGKRALLRPAPSAATGALGGVGLGM